MTWGLEIKICLKMKKNCYLVEIRIFNESFMMMSTTLKMINIFLVYRYTLLNHINCVSCYHWDKLFVHMPFHLLSAIVTAPSATTSTTTPKVTVVTQGQNTGKSCTVHVPHIALCVPMCTCDVSYNKQKIHIYCIIELFINDSLV